MTVTTCSQRGCLGHIAKFDSCRDEVLYEISDNADMTAGDTDWHGHFAYVRIPTLEVLDFEHIAGGEPVEIPAGFYIVFTSPQGWVDVTRFTSEESAEAYFMPILAEWERAVEEVEA